MTAVNATARLPETRSRSHEENDDVPQQNFHPGQSAPQASTTVPRSKRPKLDHVVDPTTVASTAPPIHVVQDPHSRGSSSDQSASHWFENANQHVPHGEQAGNAYDDEPPFFMSNQNPYMPPHVPFSESSGRIFGPSNSRMESENEDLRGVIDDLTVENKKLRHILRSHRSHRASPNTESKDKLFEVRMHGLPPEKRRELEFLLKNFATSVHASAPSISHSNSGSGVSSSSLPGGKSKTDSGYVSNSNTGQASGNDTKKIGLASKSAREKSIKNYLHDIPDTLLPRQNPLVMSERARMALVVRRLEQLFTGKSAAPGDHEQPMQQQEVSQMAARADAQGQKRRAEGNREAHILPPDSKVNFDTLDQLPEKRTQFSAIAGAGQSAGTSANSVTASRSGSPDQRPTRPLDLDIHRAQVAAENIQYIRHLGLSSPRLDPAAEPKDSSWVYLNLLINMAQLHTVNVTPTFVRQAIRKLSTKFQLSKDGNRVRWVGGSEGTVFSKEEEKALETVDNVNASPHDSTEDTRTGGSSKRSKTDSASAAVISHTNSSEDKISGLNTSSGSKQQISTGATSNLQSSLVTHQTKTGSSFDYKPLIYRERPREVEDQFLQDSDSSHDSASRESSGLIHALSRSNLNQKRHSDEGLITFYNNPYFCSDYSGDRTPPNMLKDRLAPPGDIIGIPSDDYYDESPLRYGVACYFTPQFGPAPIRPREQETVPDLILTPVTSAGEDETQPIEFHCSGLGGVTPEDNFALDVKIDMTPASATPDQCQATVPLTRTKIYARYNYRIQSCHKVTLLPSKLPPPSYIFFTSSSSSGNPDMEDSDSDSDETSSSADDEIPPPNLVQHWSADDSGDVMDEDEDDYDSSSVDMLATARAADPERIAEQERQYMINQPGIRAIAGSLAATVGASGSSAGGSDADSNMGVDSHMAVDDDEDEESDEDEDDSGH